MNSSPGIVRPRPVSLLNRQSRRSLGAVPETLQKSLTAAARRMSTTSMPAALPTDTEEPAASDSLRHHHHHHHQQQQHTAPLGDAWPTECEQGSSPERKEGGSNPEPTVSPPSSVPTTPLSPPLSPVFSAVSSEPLKPQPLASSNSSKQPYKGGPAPTHTTTTTTNPSLSGPNYFGDKYAALADLDSALHNPNHTPTPTTIDWCPSPSAKDEEPDHPHHTTIITTPTTKNKNPTPSHPTPLQRSSSEPYPITGDKYAALVNLNSTSGLTTVVDWDQTIEFKTEHASELEGPSGSACRPGAALHANYSEKPQGNCADDRGSRKMAESVRVAGNTTTLISSSPQRRSMISSSSSPAAAQTQMYGSPPQSSIMYAAQATVNSLQRPTTLFNAPFTTTTTPHPGFVHHAPVSPSAAGYIFPQQAAQHGRQVTSPVGGSWVPAYAAGAVGSQGFPVPQGAGWGQVGGFLPSPPPSHPSHPSHPFVTGAQFPGQASMCLS